LCFSLIARVGATKTSTVAYLTPVVALFYGAAFLEGSFTLGALMGLAPIPVGVTGALRLPKKPAANRSCLDLLQVDTIAV